MNTERPPAGSPWANRCPDAYPAEWYDALGLSARPAGFSRFATDDEAALIAGRVASEAFGGTRPTPSPAPGPRPGRARSKRARDGVVQRFRDLTDFMRGPHRGLTPTARAVWLCVYTFSASGRATITQAKMAELSGVSVRSGKTAVKQLEQCGLLEVLERGRPGRSSVYRCRTAVAA